MHLRNLALGHGTADLVLEVDMMHRPRCAEFHVLLSLRAVHAAELAATLYGE